MSQSNENDHLRSLFVVRHGERVDFTFCDWIKKSFDLSGKYSPYDLNMPNNVPKRKPEEFFLDSPLTKLGNLQAFAVGEAFKRFNIKISHVYCSPALRCVETCSSILDGANLDAIHINIEPALFEWLSLLSPRKPKWFSVKELISFGYRINPSYLPVLSYEETLNLEETCQEFYRRNHLATECILEHCKPSGGNVLIVAHAGSLDSCTRQLLDKAPRNDRESSNLLRFIPYCSVFHCTQSRSNEKWSICNTPSFSFANSSNLKFESKRLQ